MTVLTDDTHYKDIAGAIRAKNGTDDTYAPSEMAEAIGAIEAVPKNIAEITSGFFTPGKDLGANATYEFMHGLSQSPDVVVITSNIFDVAPSGKSCIGFMAYMKHSAESASIVNTVYQDGETSNRAIAPYYTAVKGITLVDDKKVVITSADNRILVAGVTYSWSAMRFAKEASE